MSSSAATMLSAICAASIASGRSPISERASSSAYHSGWACRVPALSSVGVVAHTGDQRLALLYGQDGGSWHFCSAGTF